jgi:transposase
MQALDIEKIKWASEKRREGYTVSQIAQALYVNEKTVYRAFHRYGFSTKKSERIPIYGGRNE